MIRKPFYFYILLPVLFVAAGLIAIYHIEQKFSELSRLQDIGETVTVKLDEVFTIGGGSGRRRGPPKGYLLIAHPVEPIPSGTKQFRVRAPLDFDYLTVLYWPDRTTEIVYDPANPSNVELRVWLNEWDRDKFHRDAYVALLAGLVSALFVLYIYDAVRAEAAQP